MTTGIKFVASVVHGADIKGLLSANVSDDYFLPSEQEVYGEVISHVKKFGAMPAVATVEKWLGGSLDEPPEVPAYYEEELRRRYVHRSLVKGITDAREYLDGSGLDPDKALEVLTETVTLMTRQQYGLRMVDFRDSLEMVTREYKKKLTEGDEYGIMMGWPALDKMSGGILPGDLVSIVGRPAMGKTFKMLYSMHHAWWHQKKSAMFLSMEMLPLPLVQRLTAMHTSKNLTHLKNAELSTKGYKQVCTQLKGVQGHDVPCWIVDGNLTASVDDIWMLCRQLQPEVLFIDGAYLLSHPDRRMNKYEKVAENTEGMKKHLATDLGIPVVASWQFNRASVKKKKDETPGLEDIGYSDAIGQLSSIALGLFEDDSNVETKKKRKVDILKGRSGETGVFYLNWDFTNMDFTQWEETDDDLGDL
jgi:replicative DNA helicase